MKKILIALLILTVAAAAFAGGAKEEEKAPAEEEKAPAEEAKTVAAEEKVIKNPDTFVYASYGTMDTLDPAKCYDNVSGGSIENIYERLIYYKGSSTSELIPVLATEVPTVANGGITNGGKTYRFQIRKGVKFHSGNPLRPEDVRYSFMRVLVVDPDAGPVWMLFEPLFGTFGSRDGEGNIVLEYSDIEKAIQVDGDYVVFNLKEPYAPFLTILAYVVACIVDKEFVIDNGGWDGTEATWKEHNSPEAGKETLYEIASGTGPYKLSRWEKGVEVVFERNENYWGPKPAMKKGIYKIVEEWSTRKLMLLQGDADRVTVDSMYYDEMNKEPGLLVYKDLKDLGVRAINFNLKIPATDNPALGSGKLDGNGISPDFFADKNVRLAFCHSWDQETLIRDIINYAGVETPTPHVEGLPFRNPDLKLYPFDLKKAEEYFKKAWGGQVWEKGFKVDFLFNTGNDVRENSNKMLAENIMSLNPKFKINVRGIEWAAYVNQIRQKTMPIFFVGWGADYPDPHNFMQPYMHSEGHFGGRCSYKNPEADRLIEEGVLETDPARRKEIYYRLQDIWLEDAIGICLYQPVGNAYFKDWVKGYVWHPMENTVVFSQFKKEY